MARICVRVGANPGGIPAQRTHPGDIVCIVDDSHVFSECEQTNGQYRIIDLPGVAPETLLPLVEHIEDASGDIVKRRVRGLDATALRSGNWLGRTTATRAQLDAITVTRD